MRYSSLIQISLITTALIVGHVAQGISGEESPEFEAAYELFAARQDAEAKAAYEAILEADPKSHKAHYFLARLAKREREWETVASHMETATKLDPENAIYWGDLGEAYGAMARKASALNQLGLARKTRDALKRAATLAPKNMAIRAGLIQYYKEAPWIAGGGMDKAIDEAESVKKVDSFRGALILGSLYQHEKKWVKAETQYREALKLQPASDEPRFALGQLFAATERYDEAASMFEDILQANPDSYGSLYQIGRVAALSGDRLERGEFVLRQYLASPVHAAGLPSHAHAWHRLGNVLEHKGDIAGARDAYQKALELNPRITEAEESLTKLRSG